MLAETCVFDKQSPRTLHCGPVVLRLCAFKLIGLPFSRSYGVILPSSLAGFLSSTFGYSPRPPVSVSSTVPQICPLAGFLGSRESTASLRPKASSTSALSLRGRIYLTPYKRPTTLSGHPSDRPSILLRHRIGQTRFKKYRNINLFPIDYAHKASP